MSPENNQPTNQPELINGMPDELKTPDTTPEEPLLDAGNTDALLEAGETPKVIDGADVPASEVVAPEATETPRVIDASDMPAGEATTPAANETATEQPSAPMNEYGGYNKITSPTLAQKEANEQLIDAAGKDAREEGDVSPVRPYVQQ